MNDDFFLIRETSAIHQSVHFNLGRLSAWDKDITKQALKGGSKNLGLWKRGVLGICREVQDLKDEGFEMPCHPRLFLEGHYPFFVQSSEIAKKVTLSNVFQRHDHSSGALHRRTLRGNCMDFYADSITPDALKQHHFDPKAWKPSDVSSIFTKSPLPWMSVISQNIKKGKETWKEFKRVVGV
jgi:hypothetical protein